MFIRTKNEKIHLSIFCVIDFSYTSFDVCKNEWQLTPGSKVVDLVGKADKWNDRKNGYVYLYGFKTGDSELDFSSPEAAIRSILDFSFEGLVTWGTVGDLVPGLNP